MKKSDAKIFCDDLRQYFVERKAQLYAELKNYPSPIARCDEHFTHLMEKRASVFQTLSQLEALCEGNASDSDCLAWLEAFVASPVEANDTTEQAIHLRSQVRLVTLSH